MSGIRTQIVTIHPDQGPTRFVDLAVVPQVGQKIRLNGCEEGSPEVWIVREIVHNVLGYVEVHL